MENDRRERRRFIRVPVGIMISVRSHEDAEMFSTNYSSDLSLGGVFIKTFSPKPVGTKVMIELPIPEHPGYAEIHGEVTYHQTQSRGDGVFSGMGVRFTKMNSQARYALQQFINGNWRSLFQRPDCLNDESKAMQAVTNILNFLEMVFFFPLGARPPDRQR